jgi:predicted dehydrogenase
MSGGEGLSRIGAAVVGAGFAGSAHADALRRLPEVELVGVAASSPDSARRAAQRLGVERAYADLDELLADERVDAVHDCAPNELHLDINLAVLRAGKHLLAEKPLGITTAETSELEREAAAAGVVAGVCFNYRFFPLVQELRARIADGGPGRPHLVRGGYLQDWLLHETDWNWRLDPSRGGEARAIGDIGSHWLDLAQHVTGERIASVLARLGRLHDERLRPAAATATFERAEAGGERVSVETEDYAAVLLRFERGCDGAFTVSQVTPGRKNRLTLEIDTAEASFAWDQEEPNRLWIGRRDGPNEELVRDPALLGPGAASLTHYPGGHQEGWPDALRNLCEDFYAAVAARQAGRPYEPTFATFAEAHRTTQIAEAILASDRSDRWVEVEEVRVR